MTKIQQIYAVIPIRMRCLFNWCEYGNVIKEFPHMEAWIHNSAAGVHVSGYFPAFRMLAY